VGPSATPVARNGPPDWRASPGEKLFDSVLDDAAQFRSVQPLPQMTASRPRRHSAPLGPGTIRGCFKRLHRLLAGPDAGVGQRLVERVPIVEFDDRQLPQMLVDMPTRWPQLHGT